MSAITALPTQFHTLRSRISLTAQRTKLVCFSLGCALAFLIGSSSLVGQSLPGTTVSQDSSEKIQTLAVVNGDSITRQDLAQLCLQSNGELVLEAMVNRLLIASESQKHGIAITREAVYQEIQKIASKWDLSTDQYLKMLAEQRSVPQEKYEQIVWTKLSLQQLAANEIQVSEEDVARQLESEVGAQVRVRIIAVRDLAKAEKVLALAQKDPTSFGTLAKEYSDDKNSAATRGLIPPLRRYAGDPKIEEVAFALQPGEVSGVIEVPGQFVILQCEKHIAGREINEQQRVAASAAIRDHLVEKNLAQAAGTMFQRLQEKVRIANVYNDETLSQQMPGVAAIVGDERITMRELAEECITRHGVTRLEAEINRKILQQQLKVKGVSVSEEAISQEVARAAESYGYTAADGSADINAWLEFNTKNGTTIENYVRDVVWPTVALKMLVMDSVQVNEEDLQKGFEANYGERVEALAIVLQDQRTATKVWKMASDNPGAEFFGQLASEYSNEQISKANFGRVPPIQKYGGQPRLEDEAFSLQSGELSGIVSVGSNWVILLCLGRTEPVVEDYDAIKDELYKDIHEKKIRLAMHETLDLIYRSSQIDNFLTGTTQVGSGAAKSARAASNQGSQLPFGNRANQ